MGKTVKHSMFPCPVYDVERIESWLEDMALEGWHLKEDGFFAGFASFDKGAPQKVRYRLEIVPKRRGSGLLDSNAAPDDEAIELSEDMGWKYIASHWQYHVYRCEDAAASEFHTDPEVQALAVNALRKRELRSLIGILIWLCLWPLLVMKGQPLHSVLALGTALAGLIALFLVCGIAENLLRYLHIRRLRIKLREKGELDHRTPWQSKKWLYRIAKFVTPLLALAIVITCLAKLADTETMDFMAYEFDPPFAMVEDIYPDAQVTYEDGIIPREVSEFKSLLAPRIIALKAMAEVKEEERKFDCFMIADYYELANEGLAKVLYSELKRAAPSARHYDELECPELSSDEEFYYIDVSPTILMRAGNKVLKATFSLYSNPEDTELWLNAFADSIK